MPQRSFAITGIVFVAVTGFMPERGTLESEASRGGWQGLPGTCALAVAFIGCQLRAWHDLHTGG